MLEGEVKIARTFEPEFFALPLKATGPAIYSRAYTQ